MTTLAYKIAEVAHLVGVAPSTLRLWESQGLVSPIRTPSGQRMYTQENVASLKHIAWLRANEGLNAVAIRSRLSDAIVDTQGELPPATTTALSIGRRLRSLRRASKKTLEQVAADVGLTLSALSTFERTSNGISFKTLHDLAHYFGTTSSALSGQETNGDRFLVPNGDWKTWPQTTPGVTIQVLAEGAHQMDCHRFVLAPGASSDGSYAHDGEEFLHLISGRLEMVLDHSEIFELAAGDSLYFESRRHHAWKNLHDGETVLIWINTPPTF